MNAGILSAGIGSGRYRMAGTSRPSCVRYVRPSTRTPGAGAKRRSVLASSSGSGTKKLSQIRRRHCGSWPATVGVAAISFLFGVPPLGGSSERVNTVRATHASGSQTRSFAFGVPSPLQTVVRTIHTTKGKHLPVGDSWSRERRSPERHSKDGQSGEDSRTQNPAFGDPDWRSCGTPNRFLCIRQTSLRLFTDHLSQSAGG